MTYIESNQRRQPLPREVALAVKRRALLLSQADYLRHKRELLGLAVKLLQVGKVPGEIVHSVQRAMGAPSQYEPAQLTPGPYIGGADADRAGRTMATNG